MLIWPPKDPDEVAIRQIDWSTHSSWLAGDAIATSTFSLTTAAGMTVDSFTDDSATFSQVKLSGGTAANRGKVLCQVTTEEGQTLQQTATILVRAR